MTSSQTKRRNAGRGISKGKQSQIVPSFSIYHNHLLSFNAHILNNLRHLGLEGCSGCCTAASAVTAASAPCCSTVCGVRFCSSTEPVPVPVSLGVSLCHFHAGSNASCLLALPVTGPQFRLPTPRASHLRLKLSFLPHHAAPWLPCSYTWIGISDSLFCARRTKRLNNLHGIRDRRRRA